jgi:hypothetical protein
MTAPATAPWLAELPFSPAAERNRQPILDTLQTLLPATGRALEIASGTGQHVAWFAQHLPGWQWQPSDLTDDLFPAIAARVAAAGLANVQAPLRIDVREAMWLPDGKPPFDLLCCANMLHIAPWACCGGLMRGAARHLAAAGRLVTYGPYLEEGVHTADGNRRFESTLRADNAEWGIRRLEDVAAEARATGLRLQGRHAMPANNLLLVWVRG